MRSPEHDGIIILGHPRSGTTLLRRVLDHHSRIACPGETHLLSACARFIQSQPTGEGVDMGVLAGLSFAGFPDEEVLERLREFALAFPRAYAARKKKPRWAEKTAFDSFLIPEIDIVFGEHVYFVGIVRHALDVAVSCLDFVNAAGTYPRVMHRYLRSYEMPLEAFVRSWIDVNEELISFSTAHPKNCVLLRYEDLIEEPADALSSLLDFVGEEFEPQMLEHDFRTIDQSGFGDHKSYQRSGISRESQDRWKELSPWMLKRLAGIANPMLEKFGYEPMKSDDDVGGVEEARRRYQVSLMLHAKRSKD